MAGEPCTQVCRWFARLWGSINLLKYMFVPRVLVPTGGVRNVGKFRSRIDWQDGVEWSCQSVCRARVFRQFRLRKPKIPPMLSNREVKLCTAVRGSDDHFLVTFNNFNHLHTGRMYACLTSVIEGSASFLTASYYNCQLADTERPKVLKLQR